MLIIEFLNFILTIISVYLLSKDNRYGWVVSLLGGCTTAYIYIYNDLPFQTLIQTIFALQSFIAFLKWRVPPMEIKTIKILHYVFLYLIIIVACLGFYKKHDFLSIVDFFLMFLSLVANHLLIYKKISSWYLWLLFDIISIILFVYLGLYITVALFVILTIICVKTILDSHPISYEKIQRFISFR
jgi:nicotinamide mononucleotide transporter